MVMNCDKADLLMMKYMDGEISISEAKLLNSHLLVCEICKEAFIVYDLVLETLEGFDDVEAPESFQDAVMVKIVGLPKLEKQHVYSKKDRMKLVLAGSFVSMLSVGAILISYREALIENFINHPVLGEYTKELAAVSLSVEGHTQSFILFTEKIIQSAEGILNAGAGVIIWGIIGLCALQIVLVRQRNR